MHRYGFSDLLMGTATLACAIALTQSQSCAGRSTRVLSLSFSADGSRLAVARFDARVWRENANWSWYGSGVIRVSDLSRTVTIFALPDGTLQKVVDSSAADQVAQRMRFDTFGTRDIQFVGEDLWLAADGQLKRYANARLLDERQFDAAEHAEFLISPDGKRLMSWGNGMVTLFDIWSGETIRSEICLQPIELPPLALNRTGTLFGVVNIEALSVWREGSKAPILREAADDQNWIGFMQDDQLAIGSRQKLRMRSLDGMETTLIDLKAGESFKAFAVSRSGELLAALTHDRCLVYEPGSKNIREWPCERGTAVCFSQDDRLVAIGDGQGHVTVTNVGNGEEVCQMQAPGRYRPSWGWPALLLTGCAAWWVRRFRHRIGRNG